jgi:hypothetical protein
MHAEHIDARSQVFPHPQPVKSGDGPNSATRPTRDPAPTPTQDPAATKSAQNSAATTPTQVLAATTPPQDAAIFPAQDSPRPPKGL